MVESHLISPNITMELKTQWAEDIPRYAYSILADMFWQWTINRSKCKKMFFQQWFICTLVHDFFSISVDDFLLYL